MKLDAFEYRVYRQLVSRLDLQGARLLIACSGGLDSVALVVAMNKIAPKMGFEIAIATVDHGCTDNFELAAYRRASVDHVRDLARMLRTDFSIARYKGESEIRSEAGFRKLRLRALEKLRTMNRCTHLVYAHHADDLFETRLMRLIRGTGPGGWQAMDVVSDTKLRPFLFERRTEIELYAVRRQLRWLEDPSNTETAYFRNWIRNVWLPQLEAKRPGSRTSFARSLTVMAESAEVLTDGEAGDVLAIDRSEFIRQPVRGRRQIIADCLRRLAVPFSRAHVEEIRKRLEVPTRTHDFRVLGFLWKVNAEQIEAVHADLSKNENRS